MAAVPDTHGTQLNSDSITYLWTGVTPIIRGPSLLHVDDYSTCLSVDLTRRAASHSRKLSQGCSQSIAYD